MRLTDAEWLMWAAERDPVLRSQFLNISVCEREIDFDRFRRRMAKAVVGLPRLRARVVDAVLPLTPPSWVEDPDFDLDHHVRRATVAVPGTERQLLDLAATLFEEPFDTARPLWQYTVVDGLAGGGGALLAKMHHTVTDGVGGIRLSAAFVDVGPDEPGETEGPDGPGGDGAAPDPDAGAAGGRPRAPGAGLLGAVTGLARRPLDVAFQAASTVVSLAGHPGDLPAATVSLAQTLLDGNARSTLWAGPRSTGRRLDVLTLSLADVKSAAHALSGTVNDVFVTGVAGGIAAYHRASGADVGELRMSMPLSTRTDKSSGGNAFLPVRVLVPAGEPDPRARFTAVHDRLARTKSRPTLGLTASLAGLASGLPSSVVAKVARQQTGTVDFVVSNVRGAPFDLWIAGARIAHNYPMGPTGGTAVNVTCLSTNDVLDVGIVTDTAAVTNPALLVSCLAEGIDELLLAAASATAGRPR
jgi:WS/DGAT/MGAT family acyltransferase